MSTSTVSFLGVVQQKRLISARMASHYKCRNNKYPCNGKMGPGFTFVERFNVPDDKISWAVEWPEYQPPELTITLNKSWEDPPIGNRNFTPLWNQLDTSIDRRSYHGAYQLRNNFPLNIIGRTGLRGRGCLGRWGPNHAADPIVTRWKRFQNGDEIIINPSSNKPILQFVAILRRDCGEWAIPGGMVDPNEDVNVTLKREFCEEAVNSLSLTDSQKADLNSAIGTFFKSGVEVYRGYVDDPRNTDNSWLETLVQNFHDSTGDTIGKFNLQAGDDAAKVQWMDIDKQLKLYASHASFLEAVARLLDAHW